MNRVAKMINKAWDKITEEDIKRLIDEAVPESHTLDYKEELPNDSPKSQLDFLFDVTSFANASGGDLIFGIKEKRDEGRPTAIPGGFAKLKMRGTLDETMRKLESLIRTGIHPILPVAINHFDNLPEGPVVIVRVPASWSAPHMVVRYSKELLRPQFYRRHNGGNHPMDINEIRAAFTVSESRVERLRQFRNERLTVMNAEAGSGTTSYVRGAKRALHVLPINSLDPSAVVQISSLDNRKWGPSPAFPYSRRRRNHFNFEGYLIQDFNPDNSKPFSYTQIFRGGAIEALRAMSDSQYVDCDFELNTIRQVKDFLNVLKDLEVPAPVFVMVSLIAVKDYPLIIPSHIHYSGPHNHLDREVLPLPECLLVDLDSPVERALRPAFDALYQTAGMPRSFNYNEDGDWIGEAVGFE